MKEEAYVERKLRERGVTRPTKQQIPELDVYYAALKEYYQEVNIILAELRTRGL